MIWSNRKIGKLFIRILKIVTKKKWCNYFLGNIVYRSIYYIYEYIRMEYNIYIYRIKFAHISRFIKRPYLFFINHEHFELNHIIFLILLLSSSIEFLSMGIHVVPLRILQDNPTKRYLQLYKEIQVNEIFFYIF